MRIATFNIENLDDRPDLLPPLPARLPLLRPMVERIAADVLCLQEVNAQPGASGGLQLRALDALLDGMPAAAFARAATRGPDGLGLVREQNLVTLSRYPIVASEQLRAQLVRPASYRLVTADPPSAEAEELTFPRPILHTTHQLPDGRLLEVVNCHWKSRLPTAIPGGRVDEFTWRSSAAWAEGSFVSAIRRLGQALETRMLVERIFDADPVALLAVCGDLNGDDTDVELRAVRGDVEDTRNPALALRTLVPCARAVAASLRFSLRYQGRGDLFDHVLASRALMARFTGAEIHNEVLGDESLAFAGDERFPASDHAPVVATFRD